MGYITKEEYEYLKKFRKYSPSVFYAMARIYAINKHKLDEFNEIPLNLEVESYFEHNMLQYLVAHTSKKSMSYSYNYKIFHESYAKYISYLRNKKMSQVEYILNSLQYLQIDSIRNYSPQVLMTYLHLNIYIIEKLGKIKGNISTEKFIEFYDIFRRLDFYWENVDVRKIRLENWEKFSFPIFDTVFSKSINDLKALYEKTNPENTIISTDISNRYPLVIIDNNMIPIVRSYKALKYSLFYYYKDNLENDYYSKIGSIYEMYICDALESDSLKCLKKEKLFHKSSGKELFDFVLFDEEIIVCVEIKFNVSSPTSKMYTGRNDKIYEAANQLTDLEKFNILERKCPELVGLKRYSVCVSYEEYHHEKNQEDFIKEIILLNTEEVLDIIFRYKGGLKGYILDIDRGRIRSKDILKENNKLENDRLFDFFDFDFLS